MALNVFPYQSVILSIFPCTCLPFGCHFRKMSIKLLCFNWMFFLVIQLYEFFVCFGYQEMACKCFLPLSRLSLNVFIASFDVQKIVSLMQSHYFHLPFLLVLLLLYKKEKIIAKSNVGEHFPYISFKKFYSYRSFSPIINTLNYYVQSSFVLRLILTMEFPEQLLNFSKHIFALCQAFITVLGEVK